MQVLHLLLPITKRLHYFYANRAARLIIIILILYLNSIIVIDGKGDGYLNKAFNMN